MAITQSPLRPRTASRAAWLTDCPLEIAELILNQLSPRDYKKLRLVSKATQAFIDAIWRPLQDCTAPFRVPVGPHDAVYAFAALTRGLDPELLTGELWLDTGPAAVRAGSYPFERVVVRCVGTSRYEDSGVELAQPVAEALAGCTALRTLALDGTIGALRPVVRAFRQAMPPQPPGLALHFHELPAVPGRYFAATRRDSVIDPQYADDIVGMTALRSLSLTGFPSWKHDSSPMTQLSLLTRLELTRSKPGGELPLVFQLPELKELIIDECTKGTLPAIEQPHGLRKLSIRCKPGADAWEVHGDFRKMRDLEHLELLSCRVAELQIGGPLALTHLICDTTATMSKLPFNIVYCTNLVTLRMGAAIRTLPESIGNLQSLRVLELSRLAIRKLPPKFGRLTNLTSLTMDQCRSIRTAPDAIGSLTNLRELHYDCGKLPLPVSFSQLVRLETVTLSGVAAQQASNVVCHWRKLRTLNLERPRERDAVENRTQTAPALANVQALPLLHCLTLADVAHNVDDNGAQRIAQLLDEATNLTRLVITHTRPGYEYLNLQAVTRLSALTNLRELCIDFVQRDRNMMFGQVRDDQLWKDIGTLANLRVLDISRNQLRELPSCVFGLTNLEVLRANRNSITYVPGSVYILQRLRVLELASAHVVKLCRELLMLPGLLTINAQVDMAADSNADVVATLIRRGVHVGFTLSDPNLE